MNRRAALAALAGGALASVGRADYGVMDRGAWPANWPKELESLRAQARTLVGPMAENRHYAIRFTRREDFEAAWPHLLKVKSNGARLVLVRGPNFFLGKEASAGVVVHAPPLEPGEEGAAVPGPQVRGRSVRGALGGTYVELIVDGAVVDLNRIPLPPDTPIADDRFKERPAR